MGLGEGPQVSDCVRVRLRVRVRDDDERRARGRDALVHVRREANRALVDDQRRVRHRRRRVGDDDELVDLGAERRHSARELGVGAVRDDDAGDAHVSSR